MDKAITISDPWTCLWIMSIVVGGKVHSLVL